jgi:hypothetical protein
MKRALSNEDEIAFFNCLDFNANLEPNAALDDYQYLIVKWLCMKRITRFADCSDVPGKMFALNHESPLYWISARRIVGLKRFNNL